MQAVDDEQLSSRIKNQKGTIINDENNIRKEKIVVLGTGWGGHAFLKTIDSSRYDVTVISPRNYFLFTPMLAASAVGTVEFRSICEPIRNVNPLADYLEASVVSIEHEKKEVLCQSVKCEGTACDISEFSVRYDHLLMAGMCID